MEKYMEDFAAIKYVIINIVNPYNERNNANANNDFINDFSINSLKVVKIISSLYRLCIKNICHHILLIIEL
jgi:hypothetical protein